MSWESFLFVVLSALILFGGVRFLLSKETIHAVLYFFMILLSTAGLIIMLNAYYIAAMQILLYAGAITILVLFVVMLTSGKAPEIPKGSLDAVLSVIFSFILFLTIALNIGSFKADKTISDSAEFINLAHIGRLLFSDYVWAFEIASVLLLVAIIGAVYLVSKLAGKEEN